MDKLFSNDTVHVDQHLQNVLQTFIYKIKLARFSNDILCELMMKYNSSFSGYDAFENYICGKAVYNYTQNVFIYEAGIEHELFQGNFSVYDPDGSKNALTVGSIDDFYGED